MGFFLHPCILSYILNESSCFNIYKTKTSRKYTGYFLVKILFLNSKAQRVGEEEEEPPRQSRSCKL